MNSQKQQIMNNILNTYVEKRQFSKKYVEKACKYLPGGDTRSAGYFDPIPIVTDYSKGYKIVDIDGNEYIDFVNNFTALIHGHAFPPVVKAIQEQVEKGTANATFFENQHDLAKLLSDRIPSVDQIRFANSATEAVMFAMRAARTFTGKDGFIRMNGGYNGSSDFVGVNQAPDVTFNDIPNIISGRGISKSVVQDNYIVPFNDLETMEKVLINNMDKIAAILMEPMLGAGGCIMPVEGYLKGVEALAKKYDVLLIFDETITLRFSEGGMAPLYGVKPDMICTGKIIGGGLPIGAFGGRRDIMELFNPSRPNSITHSGTFSGNTITMASGLAAMEAYTKPEIDRLNNLGDRLREGLNQIFKDLDIKACVQGYGSVLQIAYLNKPARTAKEYVLKGGKVTLSGDTGVSISKYVHLAMLNRGIFYAKRGSIALTTVMEESTIDHTIQMFRDTFKEVKPLF